MRAFWIAFALLCLVSPACAKERTKPKIAPLRDRASVTCRLNYADELKSARYMALHGNVGVYPIEGGDVGKFLAIFNAAEPVTDFKADRALVVSTPNFAYVELFDGGCVNHSGRLAPSDFEVMMMRAYGDGVTNGEWM